MARGFYTILAAQFFSALADNALLFVAIALLKVLHAPEWQTPVLQVFFVLSYIVLAPFVGPLADAMPKGRVMFLANTVKIVGCDAGRRQSVARVRHRRHRRRALFAGEVRHSH